MQDFAAARLDELFGAQALRALAQTPDGEIALQALKDGATGDLPRDPAGARLVLITRTGWSLLQSANLPGPAISLTREVAPAMADHPQLAHLRLAAMVRSPDRAPYLHELARLTAAAEVDPHLRAALQSIVIYHPEASIQIFPLLDRTLFARECAESSLLDRVRKFSEEGGTAVLSPSLFTTLAALRGTPADEFDTLRRDISLSRMVAGYLLFVRADLTHLSLLADRTPEQQHRLHNVTRELANYARLDYSRAQAAADRGQNVLIADLHAGLSLTSGLGIGHIGLPVSVVAAAAPANVPPPDFHIPVGVPDAQVRFLKLCKMVKAHPRVIRIFPDGPFGDQEDFEVLGRRVALGRGAPVLAWRGRAATFVPRSRWTGRSYEIVLEAGPDARDYDDGDRFAAAFFQCYLDHIRDLVLGPPIDMAPNGGFWRFFH